MAYSGDIFIYEPINSEDITATPDNVLSDKTFIGSTGDIERGVIAIISDQTVELSAGEQVTITKGKHTGTEVISAEALADQTPGTASASNIDNGKTLWVNGVEITGNIPVVTGLTRSLNCSDQFIIPRSHLTAPGTVTVNSLASQTQANAIASRIKSGYNGWVNGTQVSGSMTLQSVTKFIRGGGGASVYFSWEYPTVGPISGVIIRYSTEKYPTNLNEGTLGYKGSDAECRIWGFSPSIVYFFTCFSYTTINGVDEISSKLYREIYKFDPQYGSQTFTESGTFTVPEGITEVQVFAVGAGGTGGWGDYYQQAAEGGPGGCGGYTVTKLITGLTTGNVLQVEVGAPTALAANAITPGGSSKVTFGNTVVEARGGDGCYTWYEANSGTGWSGGSGGGHMGESNSWDAGDGGSDGSDGILKGSTTNSKGQGATTRAFRVPTAAVYSGGGGGGGYNETGYPTAGKFGVGGIGGGGNGGFGSSTANRLGHSGTPNTGGGGGGGGSIKASNAGYEGGAGGSGVVIIRWGYDFSETERSEV